MSGKERKTDKTSHTNPTQGKRHSLRTKAPVERKSQECESLKNQFAQMQKELTQKNEEIEDLRKRLSSSKLDEGQTMSDLGDPNRPSRLEQRYQQLYDHLWNDIFKELTDSYTEVDDMEERGKMAAMEIMSNFERVLQFCKHLIEDQEKYIISSLTCCPKENLKENAISIDLSTIRNMRRSIASKTLPSIVQLYTKQNDQELTVLMNDFVKECIAICWLTQIHDPPMAFEFNYDHGVQLDKEFMREFTVSGDIVDYVVWPSMRLTLNGPVMVKSVVQPINKKRQALRLNEELTNQQEEKAILSEENKVRYNLIDKLNDNNRKLEQDINGYKESVVAMEKQGKIEMKKLSMEIEFSTVKLQEAHSEITKLKENEKKFLEKIVVKDGEQEMPNEKLKTIGKQLIEEQKAHKKTKKEEKFEKEELQRVTEELLYEKDTLINELTQVRADRKQKNEELDSIGNELIRSSDLNERKSRECESLKDQIAQMQNELKQKNEELDSTGNELIRSGDLNERKSRECESLKDQIVQMQNELKQKNEELDSIGNELIRSSDLNERKSQECQSLKDQCAQMQNGLKQKTKELDDLQNKLSSLSARKLNGDENITDLGDPNRPLKLVERYQQLYDNIWTDIFDELTDSYHDVNSSGEREKMAAMEIMSIFEGVLKFCQHLVEDQEKAITCCTHDNLDQNASNIDISTLRNIRKSNAQQTLPSIVQQYDRQNEQDLTGLMRDFEEECIAICWLTQVHDPPIAFEFNYDHGVQLDKDLMREFTVSGDIVDYVVWPTMRLTSDGPVMVKSVVQPIKKKR